MEARWCSIVGALLLMFSALNLCLYYHHQPTFTTQSEPLHSIIQYWTKTFTLTTATVDDETTPWGPNVTTCRASFTDAAAPISCCVGIKPYTDVNMAVDFKFPTFTQPRVRRPVHVITDDDYISKYRKAVAIMKSLPAENPHSFVRQANIHCIYCTGSFHQINNDDVLFKIHKTWLFFPFHRAYVYFHERILAKLIGDDSFAVPYWAWDVPAGMVMPEMFMNGSLWHEVREVTHLPPKVTQNDFTDTESGLSDKHQVEANLALMYNQMVSAAKTPELFMGCKMGPGKEGACEGFGTIENEPHNTVHGWVGQLRNKEREDMGAFYSAARDPLFYPHHANIDRLWTVWKDVVYGNKSEFDDPTWLDAFFYFYDENHNLVRIKVRDLLDMDRLGYRYESIERPWLDAKPKPSMDPKVARGILKSSGKLLHGTKGYMVLNVNYNSVITVKVERPKRQSSQRRLEEVLVVYGIDVDENVRVKFDVFVNVVNETSAVAGDARWREFAGSYVNMAMGKRVEARQKNYLVKSELKLGISELLTDLQVADDEWIWVTVVRRDKNDGFTVTIDGIRIELMPLDRDYNAII